MAWVRRWFCPLPLVEAVERLRCNNLPRRAICITFDDGYEDNVSVAAPVLSEFGLPATFFIATGFMDGEAMWNDRLIEAVRAAHQVTLKHERLESHLPLATVADRRDAVRTLLRSFKHLPVAERERAVRAVERQIGVGRQAGLMMGRAGVQQLARSGFTIGAHSISHPILSVLDEVQAEHEIRGGRDELQQLLQQPIEAFAYPNGRPGQDYTAAHVRMVRAADFRCAVSTAVGAAGAGADPFQLPRFTPWDQTPWRYLLRSWATARRPRFEVVDPDS
jgi:peptidoglycan/xylan/chitin deacetylase (PgdA/CDA1 family)